MSDGRLRLAVIGDPVEHSASPTLHRGFMAAAQLQGTYDAIRVVAGDGAQAIDDLRVRRYDGLSVTTPLKEEAFARADVLDANALACRAVNTLLLGSRIEGTNTDGIGVLAALRETRVGDVAGARVLVLGTGPTARAATAALVAADAVVFLWNRSSERAAAIARELDAQPFRAGIHFDAVFSALPPGATPADDRVRTIVLDAPGILDANYGERSTLGASLGRPVTDGTTMLQHGARAAFEAFRTAIR